MNGNDFLKRLVETVCLDEFPSVEGRDVQAFIKLLRFLFVEVGDFRNGKVDKLDVEKFPGLVVIDIRGDEPVGRMAQDAKTIFCFLFPLLSGKFLETGKEIVLAAVEDFALESVADKEGQDFQRGGKGIVGAIGEEVIGFLEIAEGLQEKVLRTTGLDEDKAARLSLHKVRGAKFIPDKVELKVLVDLYTEKTVEVPIVGLNFPASKDLRTFPSKVKVNFRVGMSRFKSITADDFVLAVTYEELLQNEDPKIRLHLKSMPPGVSNVRIDPVEVDYLIEQVQEEGGE